MNNLRHAILISKKDTPKTKRLPPVDLAIDQHILRTHLQTMLRHWLNKFQPQVLDNYVSVDWEVRTQKLQK